MTRLLLVNGLPGTGKSTLARRWVADRPLALCLDVDVVRALLGAWKDQPREAGLLARRLALAMARTALDAGHDVVVPQFLARSAFVGELAGVADAAGVAFVEVVLLENPDRVAERLADRAAGPMSEIQRDAHELLDRQGGLAAVPELDRRLRAMIATRPATRVVTPVRDDVEATYRALLAGTSSPD